jgi:hypothetical protein
MNMEPFELANSFPAAQGCVLIMPLEQPQNPPDDLFAQGLTELDKELAGLAVIAPTLPAAQVAPGPEA